jgi:hypothetical protein
VAEILAGFVKLFDPHGEKAWVAERDDAIVGSVFLVRASSTARRGILRCESAARRGVSSVIPRLDPRRHRCAQRRVVAFALLARVGRVPLFLAKSFHHPSE